MCPSKLTLLLYWRMGMDLIITLALLKPKIQGILVFMTGCALIRSAGWLFVQPEQHVVADGVG